MDAMLSLEHALREAVALDRDSVIRLAYAHTSVSFGLEGTDERVTLILDGERPEVIHGGDGEVGIDFDLEQCEIFTRGQLDLQHELQLGRLPMRGPARSYLAADPMVKGLLRELSGEEGNHYRADASLSSGPKFGTAGSRASEKGLDSDLLAIEARNVHKAFGSNSILRGVNVGIPEGSISVLMGPSGTGKSVMLSHIIGLLKPDRGEVLVRGRSLNKMSRQEILDLRLEIGVMFQDGALFSTMNLYDNVAFPLRQHTDMNEREVDEIVMRHIESVGLQNALDRLPPQLSGGMRKRAGLARALVLDPGIILCDEPDSGLDPVRTALLGDLLVETHAEIGGTMIVITHNIELARRVANHITVLWRGKVVEAGSAESVLNSDNQFIRQFLAGESRGPLGMDA